MRRYSKSQNAGFTLLEMMIITVIIGILAGSGMYSVSKFIGEKRADQQVMTLWSELNSLRARAIKDNCYYLVELGLNNGTYVVYRNDNKDYVTSTSTPITAGFGAVSGKVSFGMSDPIPDPFPSQWIPWVSYVHKTTGTDQQVRGSWTKNVNVLINGNQLAYTMVFKNDEIGYISDGVLYVKSSAIKNQCYAFIKKDKATAINLYKWDGSKWYEM